MYRTTENFNPKIITNYIYFYHIDKFCILPTYPEKILDNMSSTFKETNALSRSAPVWTYSNSGPRTVQLDFDLHRDMMNDLNKDISNLKQTGSINSSAPVVDWKTDDYIDVLIKCLQSIALPKYELYSKGSKSVEPPMVAVRLGSGIFIKGVVNSGINITYNKPINSEGKYMLVNVSFTISETDPYDALTVLDKGSFRGISSANKIEVK